MLFRPTLSYDRIYERASHPQTHAKKQFEKLELPNQEVSTFEIELFFHRAFCQETFIRAFLVICTKPLLPR